MDNPKDRIEVVPSSSSSDALLVPHESQYQHFEPQDLPLPKGWECRLDPKGHKYYVNHNTCTTTWECPMPEKDFEGNFVAEENPLPGGWEFRLDSKGRKYYLDHNTRTTSWERPPSLDIESIKLPTGWEVRFGEGKRSTYFVDHNTMTTTWEDPRIHTYQLEPAIQFQRKIKNLHKIAQQAKVPGNFLIKIRRSHVFEDSFALLIEQPETELKKQLHVIFEGESSEGDIREWFDLLFGKLLDTKLGLFELDAANKVKIKTDATSPTHLRYFKFVGRLHILAIIHEILVDPKFVGIFYPMVTIRMDKTKGADLIDSAVKEHMAHIKKLKLVSATLPCLLDNRTGKPFSADLKLEAGRHTFLNYNDKEEFLEAFTAQRSGLGGAGQLRAFMDGFWGLFDKKDIFLTYSQSELEKAIGGISEIDFELCSNSTEQEPDKHLEWFYRIVQSWSVERQRALLHYVTGLKRVPATDQFKVMKAPNGCIRRLSVLGNKERAVPDNNADTPEHMLFIPVFEEYQAMEDELISVIYNCDEWDETAQLSATTERLSLNQGEDGKST